MSLSITLGWPDYPERRALAARLIAEQGVSEAALMVGRADLDRIVAKAVTHGGIIAVAEVLGERSCRVCGCTQLAACHPPCWWAGPDLCSACEPYLAATVQD